jgi:hypothetical protein
MWLDRHGQHVLTGEPYKSSILDDDDERDAFREAMADLGLRVTFDPDGSAWNPPSTLLVLVTTGNQNEASNQQPHDAGERPPFLRSNTR